MEILILVNFSIFVLISARHFYWAFGGAWASKAVLPERTEGTKLIHPREIRNTTGCFRIIVICSHHAG